MAAAIPGAVAAEADAMLRPCSVPLQYRVGAADSRFGLTPQQWHSAVQAAVSSWEQRAGLDLFAAAADTTFTISLVYDERQGFARFSREMGDYSGRVHQLLDELQRDFQSRLERYRTDAAAYRSRLDAFSRAARDFQSAAGRWQRNPGTEAERAALVTRQRSLLRESASLEAAWHALHAEEQWLRVSERRLRETAQTHNRRVTEANRLVDSAPVEFAQLAVTQMEGPSTRIDVYQFIDRRQLQVILLHELGHALGLGHSEDPDSIMHAQWDGAAPQEITPADLETVRRACRPHGAL